MTNETEQRNGREGTQQRFVEAYTSILHSKEKKIESLEVDLLRLDDELKFRDGFATDYSDISKKKYEKQEELSRAISARRQAEKHLNRLTKEFNHSESDLENRVRIWDDYKNSAIWDEYNCNRTSQTEKDPVGIKLRKIFYRFPEQDEGPYPRETSKERKATRKIIKSLAERKMNEETYNSLLEMKARHVTEGISWSVKNDEEREKYASFRTEPLTVLVTVPPIGGLYVLGTLFLLLNLHNALGAVASSMISTLAMGGALIYACSKVNPYFAKRKLNKLDMNYEVIRESLGKEQSK